MIRVRTYPCFGGKRRCDQLRANVSYRLRSFLRRSVTNAHAQSFGILVLCTTPWLSLELALLTAGVGIIVYTLLHTSLILLIFALYRSIGFSVINFIKSTMSVLIFLSVSVSGMDISELVCGRPFGGSILYRKTLASCITPLDSCSNRFCGVKFNCSSGLSMLLICVYLPSSSYPSNFTEYLNTLGELSSIPVIVMLL